MDLSKLMEMASQLRQQLANAQEEAGKVQVQGEAGAGLVRVVMNGRYEIVDIKLDPKVVDPAEVAFLEDLLRAAVNQAASQVAQELQGRLGSMAQNMGIDPAMLGPFGESK